MASDLYEREHKSTSNVSPYDSVSLFLLGNGTPLCPSSTSCARRYRIYSYYDVRNSALALFVWRLI